MEGGRTQICLLQPRTSPFCHGKILKLVFEIERLCLHALVLGRRLG
ncbi:hypothetical protein Patl1_15689 [Pistacia atlantica]|uniref:Uncharacterized protein n=1 Tax=Pistacia atlantica TaxID=434234 RepID=A0ACC1B912_9ROSI|nr:hypothetical protein Patl1_15689 [Pistacia atlantica]